jgi:hypothetical protein
MHATDNFANELVLLRCLRDAPRMTLELYLLYVDHVLAACCCAAGAILLVNVVQCSDVASCHHEVVRGNGQRHTGMQTNVCCMTARCTTAGSVMLCIWTEGLSGVHRPNICHKTERVCWCLC